jgi:hypothetical protein
MLREGAEPGIAASVTNRQRNLPPDPLRQISKFFLVELKRETASPHHLKFESADKKTRRLS